MMKSPLIFLSLFMLVSCQEKPSSFPKAFTIVSTTLVLDHFVSRAIHGIPNVSHELAVQTQGKCLHDHAISMDEIRTLCKASLIVANGLDYEPFLDKVMAQCPHVPVFRAFEGCSPIPLHEKHEHQNIDSHQDSGFDPHAWFGAKQVDCMIQNLGNTLQKLDTAHQEYYSTNSRKTENEIQIFWDSLHTQYASLQGTGVVVFHSSYDYLMQEFGIHAIASVSEEFEESTPSAKQISKLIETIHEHKVQILLAGESELPEIAHMVAKESGARLVPMLTLLETMDTNDAHAYENAIKENLRRISP